MSLILEALRKSDAERRLGRAPDLLAAMPVLRSRAPGRRWTLVVPAVLFVIAILVVAGWWLTRRTTIPPNSAPVVAQSPPRARVDAQARDAMPVVPQEQVPATADNHPLRVLPSNSQQKTTPAPDLAVTPLPVSPRPTPTPRPRPALATDAERASHATRPSAVANSAVGSATVIMPVPAPLVSSAPVSNPLPSADEPALLSLSDLSAGERSSLPALKVTMHVYASEPAQRFIIVDGQRVGEGARLADGVTLVHIRHDGAEIDAHGQHLLLPKP